MSKEVEDYIKSLKEELDLNNDINISLEKELKIELLTNQLYNYEETIDLQRENGI